MDDDTSYFVGARTEVEGLPISQTLIHRLESIADAEGNMDADAALGAVVAAIVALEREFRSQG
jgi:hypothetical protein